MFQFRAKMLSKLPHLALLANKPLRHFSGTLSCVNHRFLTHRYFSTARPEVLNNAEQILDTPLSHFEIRNLMKDEYDLSKFTLDRVAKLSDHPIIDAAQDIFNNLRGSGGLLMLLLGRLILTVPSFRAENPKLRSKQKIFAECYEMIDKAMYIHYHAILDNKTNTSPEMTVSGDKLAILGGDYLFSFGIIRLASMVRSAQVFDFIGASIDSYCINQFTGDDGDTPSPINFADWEKYGGYASAELMGYCAQFLVTQAQITSIRYEKVAFELGYNLKLKWNLENDLKLLRRSNGTNLHILFAPALLYCQSHPEFNKYMTATHLSDPAIVQDIKGRILSDPVTMDKCRTKIDSYTTKCHQAIETFPESRERTLLQAFVQLPSVDWDTID